MCSQTQTHTHQTHSKTNFELQLLKQSKCQIKPQTSCWIYNTLTTLLCVDKCRLLIKSDVTAVKCCLYVQYIYLYILFHFINTMVTISIVSNFDISILVQFVYISISVSISNKYTFLVTHKGSLFHSSTAKILRLVRQWTQRTPLNEQIETALAC